MDRLKDFTAYYAASAAIGDIDPQNACLRYVADRYELNMEQRYWLAFLFGTCYCAPTVFYIYNEFPDYENVDIGRLQRWWAANRAKCLFQTDRLRIKTQDLFVETFVSYQRLLRGRTQREAFYDAAGERGVGSRADMYRAGYALGSQIRNFGRFTMFIYLELVHELTDFKMQPAELDVKNALSSRNGLCYALGFDHLIDKDISKSQAAVLEQQFARVTRLMQAQHPRASAWSVETALCAFKKHIRGKRWVGYYLDRQHDEIAQLQRNVPNGVDWSVLWQHRAETHRPEHCVERTGRRSSMQLPYSP